MRGALVERTLLLRGIARAALLWIVAGAGRIWSFIL